MEQLISRVNKLNIGVKLGILVGLALAVTAACYFLLIADVETEIEALKNQAASLNKTLAEKKALADNLNEARREMDELDQKLQEASTILPEKKDIGELLATLNDIGRKSGLEIVNVAPGAESFQGYYAKIPVQMSVVGNYHEIAMFLQEVANMRRVVNVNNIHLGAPTIRNDKVMLRSEFLATTFRFNNQAKGAKK